MFFFRQLLSKLTERNSTKTGQGVRLKLHFQIFGVSLPVKNQGPKSHLFSTFFDEFET